IFYRIIFAVVRDGIPLQSGRGIIQIIYIPLSSVNYPINRPALFFKTALTGMNTHIAFGSPACAGSPL
ncbi:MAG: hypothetical protein U9N40_09835, partial [Euryarchaeota archaeon]|nr:hypothetical protein [Euryarchaeota archaeon]